MCPIVERHVVLPIHISQDLCLSQHLSNHHQPLSPLRTMSGTLLEGAQPRDIGKGTRKLGGKPVRPKAAYQHLPTWKHDLLWTTIRLLIFPHLSLVQELPTYQKKSPFTAGWNSPSNHNLGEVPNYILWDFVWLDLFLYLTTPFWIRPVQTISASGLLSSMCPDGLPASQVHGSFLLYSIIESVCFIRCTGKLGPLWCSASHSNFKPSPCCLRSSFFVCLFFFTF